MVPVVSESGKQSESAKQLEAAEQQAKDRFEKRMAELREGAYRFSSRARGQSELIIEELIDPDGDTVAGLAEVEGDAGVLALGQSLELITFDTWLFGQIGDREALDLKAEDHWEIWFQFGAWIGETLRRRHGGHWLTMGDDPHTWRIGFSKMLMEIAPFVFSERLLRMGSGATRSMVTEIERIRQLHEPDPAITARVPFAADTAEVAGPALPMLEEIARYLVDSDHITSVGIDGYAAANEAGADALAQRRADAVKAFLVERRVDAKRLEAHGQGATHARETDDASRRVEFEVLEHGERRLLDRFLPQHYIRMHTVPLGQFMSMDFANLAKLWNEEPCEKLIAELKEKGPRLGPQNVQIVEQVVGALSKAKLDTPVAKQTNDRGLFEAVAQIIALRRATTPVAIDILERVVMPALHVGIPEKFPPLDEDDLGNLHKQVELFHFFTEVVPHKFQADDEGFLGTIPHEQLGSPYNDGRNVLEIGKGDWVIVNPAHFIPMLQEFDPQKLLDKYDEFVKYVASIPEAPRRRDDGRMLAETAVRALADLKACVATAAQNRDALLFRLLPPQG